MFCTIYFEFYVEVVLISLHTQFPLLEYVLLDILFSVNML